MIPNVQVFRVTKHVDVALNVRSFPQNDRDQHSSMLVHGDNLTEILRADKKFLRVTVVRGCTGEPSLDFVPYLQGIDMRGLAIFARDEELGAAAHRGDRIRRNS